MPWTTDAWGQRVWLEDGTTAGALDFFTVQRLRQLEQQFQFQAQPPMPPNPNAAILETLRTAIATEQTKVKEKEASDEVPERLINNTLYGADPEFVIINGDEAVIGRDFMPAAGEVGHDHNGYVYELRPRPAKGTYTLVKRMQKLLQSPKLEKLRSYKWRAGALVDLKVPATERATYLGGKRTLTLGGHVHIDKPWRNRELGDFDLMISACDRATKYLESLDILPQNESLRRREIGATHRYGAWGDVRGAGREDAAHTEYRTPCSWLFDPKAAFLTLTAIKLATVNPQLTLDTLKARGISFERLKEWFELYKHKDDNAARVVEKLLDKDIKKIQADPNSNFRETWEGELAF